MHCLGTAKLSGCPVASHHCRVSPHPYQDLLQPYWHNGMHAHSLTQFCQNVLVEFKNQLLKVFKLT